MCGCVKNKNTSVSAPTGVVSTTNPPTDCTSKRDTLVALNGKVVKLFQFYKTNSKRDESHLMFEMNKKLSMWIREITQRCPDQHELEQVQNSVEYLYQEYDANNNP